MNKGKKIGLILSIVLVIVSALGISGAFAIMKNKDKDKGNKDPKALSMTVDSSVYQINKENNSINIFYEEGKIIKSSQFKVVLNYDDDSKKTLTEKTAQKEGFIFETTLQDNKVAVGTADIKFSYGDFSVKIVLNVLKANPVISNDEIIVVHLGDTLQEAKEASAFAGVTTSVEGEFVWSDDIKDHVITKDDHDQSFEYTFYPTDDINYNAVTRSVKLHVVGMRYSDFNTIKPQIVEDKLHIGKKVSDLTLTVGKMVDVKGNTVEGTWTYLEPDKVIDKNGFDMIRVLFTPNDTNTYDEYTFNIDKQILCVYASAINVVEEPTVAKLVETTEEDSNIVINKKKLVLSGGKLRVLYVNDDDKEISFDDCNIKLIYADNKYTFTATYDGQTYTGEDIQKIDVNITKLEDASFKIKAGSHLGTIDLNSGAYFATTAGGTFKWVKSEDLTIFLADDGTDFEYIFTPFDTAAFNSCRASVKLEVEAIDYTPNNLTILEDKVYRGRKIQDLTISCSSVVDENNVRIQGVWSFVDPDITIGEEGLSEVWVKFTPSYNVKYKEKTFKIEKNITCCYVVDLIIASNDYSISGDVIETKFEENKYITGQNFIVSARLNDETGFALELDNGNNNGYTFESTLPNNLLAVGKYTLTFSYDGVKVEKTLVVNDYKLTVNYPENTQISAVEKSKLSSVEISGITVKYHDYGTDTDIEVAGTFEWTSQEKDGQTIESADYELNLADSKNTLFKFKFVATDSMFGEISGETQIEVTKLASKAISNFEEYASAISFEKDYLDFGATLETNKLVLPEMKLVDVYGDEVLGTWSYKDPTFAMTKEDLTSVELVFAAQDTSYFEATYSYTLNKTIKSNYLNTIALAQSPESVTLVDSSETGDLIANGKKLVLVGGSITANYSVVGDKTVSFDDCTITLEYKDSKYYYTVSFGGLSLEKVEVVEDTTVVSSEQALSAALSSENVQEITVQDNIALTADITSTNAKNIVVDENSVLDLAGNSISLANGTLTNNGTIKSENNEVEALKNVDTLTNNGVINLSSSNGNGTILMSNVKNFVNAENSALYANIDTNGGTYLKIASTCDFVGTMTDTAKKSTCQVEYEAASLSALNTYLTYYNESDSVYENRKQYLYLTADIDLTEGEVTAAENSVTHLAFCGTLIVNKGITLNLGGKTFILAIEYKNGKFLGSDNIADVKNYGTIKNGTINAIDGSTVKEYKKLGTWENVKSSVRWTAFY